MTPTDAYLQRVARGLSGMDPRLREDVLRELRSHLADAAVAEGESAALSAAEAPESVAARYRELYGYGAAYQAAFTTVAAFLAVLTVPVFVYAISVPASLIASLFLLVVLAAYLMIVAVRAGSRAGAVAGVAACLARIATVFLLDAPAAQVVADANGWITFLAVSVGLIALGYLPGRAREKWRAGDVSM